MQTFSCQALLFDLDGVLVDSTPCVTRVWQAWARRHGLDPDYVVHVAHGQRTIETVRTVAPHLDAERETQAILHEELNDTDGLIALPGTKALLAELPAGRFAIVTSGVRQLAVKRLEAAGLPVPATIVSAANVSRGKPDPEPYAAGARLLGVEPSQCLAFEDAPSGIQSARAAGANVIAILSTYKAGDLQAAALVIPSLAYVQVRIKQDGSLSLTVGG